MNFKVNQTLTNPRTGNTIQILEIKDGKYKVKSNVTSKVEYVSKEFLVKYWT